jgi:hypothetical protein
MGQANTTPLVLGTDRAGSILNDQQTMAGSDLTDFCQGRRQSDLMNYQNGSRSSRYRTLDAIRIQIVCRAVDVNKDRACSSVNDTVRGCNERKTRTDYFISRLHAPGQQRQM